ncbi:MAG TPA: class II glutamine amidotransferase, partial [Acidimicrobiia bacterium]|nr:class II glutamine amidotransferase [Acidimicrobiia bacterium]
MNGPAHQPDADLHAPGEACGVFGVFAPGERASTVIYFGLFALQHRGQESAGIATTAGETVTVVKDLGLVANVFDEADLAGLDGHMGIGHTRYSTTGSSSWENAQPVHRQKGSTSIALGHNGNLTNTKQLAELYGDGRASTDSDLMLEAIARQVDDERGDLRGLEMAMIKVLPEFEGAFSLVVMDQGHLVGVRDPRGFRPLCIGRFANGGWVLSSETAAL